MSAQNVAGVVASRLYAHRTDIACIGSASVNRAMRSSAVSSTIRPEPSRVLGGSSSWMQVYSERIHLFLSGRRQF